jgi:hypothetical protein
MNLWVPRSRSGELSRSFPNSSLIAGTRLRKRYSGTKKDVPSGVPYRTEYCRTSPSSSCSCLDAGNDLMSHYMISIQRTSPSFLLLSTTRHSSGCHNMNHSFLHCRQYCVVKYTIGSLQPHHHQHHSCSSKNKNRNSRSSPNSPSFLLSLL